MDIFIIEGRGEADGSRAEVVVASSQRRRSAMAAQQNFGPIGLPSLPDINIDENDTFIRERQVRPRRKSQEIYRDAASRRQPFLRRSYIKQSLQANSNRREPMLMRFLLLDRSTFDSLKSVVSCRFFKCSRQTATIVYGLALLLLGASLCRSIVTLAKLSAAFFNEGFNGLMFSGKSVSDCFVGL